MAGCPTLVTQARRSGCAMRAQLAIWPDAAHAHLDDEHVGVGVGPQQTVSGTPSSLLRLPSRRHDVAAPSTSAERRKSFVVVLPVEPVTPTTGAVQARAMVARQVLHAPQRVGHRTTRRVADRPDASNRRRAVSSSARHDDHARAPASSAAPTNSWPSTRSPGSATKTQPGAHLARVDRDAVGDRRRGCPRAARRRSPRAIVSTAAVSIGALNSSRATSRSSKWIVRSAKIW